MGQCFDLINMTRNEWLSPLDAGCGAKLFEFCNIHSLFAMELCKKLKDEWYGECLVIAGEYIENEIECKHYRPTIQTRIIKPDELYFDYKQYENYNFYEVDDDTFEVKKYKLLKELEDCVFVNFKRHCYIQWDYGFVEDEWNISPICMLLLQNNYEYSYVPDNYDDNLAGEWVGEPVAVMTREEANAMNYYEIFILTPENDRTSSKYTIMYSRH